MKSVNQFLIILTLLVTNCQLEKHKKMTHILRNKNLEIHIDMPLSNYNLSRFDWTGKITSVKFKDKYITGVEIMNTKNENEYGKGLYNEFGIESAIGHDDINKGDWFHKIGIGALKKEDDVYDFSKSFPIQPAIFKVETYSNKIIINCESQIINGYGYILKKEIELLDSSFSIKYFLTNTGDKTIKTDEYTHNFLAFNSELLGTNYILKFPFEIKPQLFEKTFNPEKKVEIRSSEITFNSTPEKQFFFSNLSGGKEVDASWELINTNINIGISETGSFKTYKVNLWGWGHVVSPELFFQLNIEPGQSVEWTRTYNVFEIN